MRWIIGITSIVLLVPMGHAAPGAVTQKRYYAHDTIEDAHGVIASWYKGQNGQCDLRVRVAAETLKRYPWTDTTRAAAAVPEYVFSGAWKIAPDGTITIPPISDWANGDLGQRAAYVLSALIDYYRYSGDAGAIAHITAQADALLDHCLTPPDHPWPNFLISVPVKGQPYGQANPHGFIQLDIVAEVGLPLIRASQLTGNRRWFEAAKHWGDLLAEKRNREPGMPPWPRYANPQDVPWEDHATGGVAFILDFFDALIRAGHTGKDNHIVEARQAGVAYLRDVLLPDWTGVDTWGRNYWDWPCGVQVENVTEFAARYLMEHPDEFPNWRSDARNIMTLFLNRTSVSPNSNGDVFSGAWAYPESCGCCGRSLWYGPMELANVYAQYGVLADSAWGREMARRQMILATYDFHETGVVEDNIDGGAIVAGDWFKIAHPMALKHVLAAMAWLPEVLGPSRENHIMRSTGVVTDVSYGDGLITYQTYDAPSPSIDVLRLAFRPGSVTADDKPLPPRTDGRHNGYQVKDLPDGDCLVTIRHDGANRVRVQGDDPQESIDNDDPRIAYAGSWITRQVLRIGSQTGDTMTCRFAGNQVRVMGAFTPASGLADVYIDGVKQLAGIDCWNPSSRPGVLYYKNGLADGEHTLKVVVKGARNSLSQGTDVPIGAVQFSAALPQAGRAEFGEGGGPSEAQRFLFGYSGREDVVDSAGQAWRPGTEFIIRAGPGADPVATSWWTQRRRLHIAGTDDPELYRYGVHGKDFTVHFTVAPGTYHARLKFAETRNIEPKLRAVTVYVNGRQTVTDMDIAATASAERKAVSTQPRGDPYTVWSGLHRAVDVVLNGISPENGVISIRFTNDHGGEAVVQAIEVAPGDGGTGTQPVLLPEPAASEPASGDKAKQ